MKYITPIFMLASILFFATCQQPDSRKKTNDTLTKNQDKYLKKGKEITTEVFATLSGNLKKAMQEGGVEHAVKYCNMAAYPLVDSLSKVHDVSIKRTSLQLRNPKNKPTPKERVQLNAYHKQVEAGTDLKPVLEEIDAHTVAFYAPIILMPACEKCHGKLGSTLSEKDYEVIQSLYPQDAAIGYVSGRDRGMWSVTFKK